MKKKNNLGKPKGSTSWKKTIGDLAPAFYSLAIASTIMGSVVDPMLKEYGWKYKDEARLLKKRGLVIVIITDKSIETTYQESKDIEKKLNLFCKLNKGKWKWNKENYSGIKTGRYELTRIYRKYNKPIKEPKVCKECGRSLEDYDD